MSEREPDDIEDLSEVASASEPYDLEDDQLEDTSGKRFDADFLLDKVIPGEIDWRRMVRQHPVVCIGAAGLLGFLLGRSRGAAIVAGASAAVTNAVMRQLSDVFEGEVFEF